MVASSSDETGVVTPDLWLHPMVRRRFLGKASGIAASSIAHRRRTAGDFIDSAEPRRDIDLRCPCVALKLSIRSFTMPVAFPWAAICGASAIPVITSIANINAVLSAVFICSAIVNMILRGSMNFQASFKIRGLTQLRKSL